MNLNEDKVPTTINEAVEMLFNALSDSDREDVKKHPPEAVHFTLGMYLRNGWSLWERDMPLNRDFRERFKLFGHGDDVSGMILKSVWAKVCGLNVEEIQKAEAEHYRQHWQRAGLDPETGERNPAAVPPETPRTVCFEHGPQSLGEHIAIVPDDGSGRAFDTLLKAPGLLKDMGDLHVVVKANGTRQGRPIVMLTFTVVLPDGTRAPVQTVTTLRNFLNAAQILRAKYPSL